MKTISNLTLSLLLGATIFALGCGGTEGTNTANRPPATNTPSSPPKNANTNTPTMTTAMSKAQETFAMICSSCHLADGTGAEAHEKDGIPDFTDRAWQQKESDEELKKAIMNGKGKIMPPFKDRLDPEVIDALVTYVRGFPDRPRDTTPSNSNGSH